MIRIVSVALPRSPANLAQGDEFSQIITPITRQRPSEILHLLQNDFCNTITPTTGIVYGAAERLGPSLTLISILPKPFQLPTKTQK